METVTENNADGRGPVNNRSGAYRSWKAMRQRCNQKPGHRHWGYYGAKGITVCPRWNDFFLFLEDMGPRPDGATLDRRDGSKGYSKENCRWASWSEQNANKEFTTVEIDGNSVGIKSASREIGINYSTVHARINLHGWTAEKALKTPVSKHEFEFDGRSMTITKWAKETGIPRATLMARIHREKWPLEKALTTPVRRRLTEESD